MRSNAHGEAANAHTAITTDQLTAFYERMFAFVADNRRSGAPRNRINPRDVEQFRAAPFVGNPL